MEQTLKSKVSEIFSRYQFAPEDAKFIADVLAEIDERQEQKFLLSKELFLTQPDKGEIMDRMGANRVELIEKIEEVRTDLTGKIEEVRTDLTEKIEKVRADLTEKIEEVKADSNDKIHSLERRLTKQIYLVGLVQFFAIIAALIGILNFVLK